MGWEKKLSKARKLHRPKLKNWECDGLAEVFSSFVSSLSDEYESLVLGGGGDDGSSSSSTNRNDFLQQKDGRMEEDEEESNNIDNHHNSSGGGTSSSSKKLPVVLDGSTLSCEEFFSQYESPCVPCIIRGIPNGSDGGTATAGSWPAVHKWTLEALENDPVLRERKYKCGEDDEGYSVKVKLTHFMKYLHSNRDDSPLYIFDRAFEDDKHAKRLLDDYRVPSYFRDDLFRLCSERSRPPYRWFLIGPERSGTTVHVDPLATSAWNTLIVGKKRWVLFPPHVPKSIVKGKGLVGDDEDDEAIHYFMYILPRIKRKALEAAVASAAAATATTANNNHTNNNNHDCYLSSSYQNNNNHHKKKAGTSAATNHQHNNNKQHVYYKDFACYEFTQHAGETIYIPHGWWHAVLNITHTVGVTQNFCSQQNFDNVWVKTRSGRKKLAYKWLLRLREEYPHLYDRARSLNARDNFRMKYEEEEEEEKKTKKETSTTTTTTTKNKNNKTNNNNNNNNHDKDEVVSLDDDSDDDNINNNNNDNHPKNHSPAKRKTTVTSDENDEKLVTAAPATAATATMSTTNDNKKAMTIQLLSSEEECERDNDYHRPLSSSLLLSSSSSSSSNNNHNISPHPITTTDNNNNNNNNDYRNHYKRSRNNDNHRHHRYNANKESSMNTITTTSRPVSPS